MAFLPLFCHFISRWGTSLFFFFQRSQISSSMKFQRFFVDIIPKNSVIFLELLLPLVCLILVLTLCDFLVTLMFGFKKGNFIRLLSLVLFFGVQNQRHIQIGEAHSAKTSNSSSVHAYLGSLGSMTLYFSKVTRQVQGMPRSCSSGIGETGNLGHSALLN